MLLFTNLSKIRKFSCSSTCFQGKEIVTSDSKMPEPEPLLSEGIESAKPVVKLKQELIPEKKKDQLGANMCGIQMLSERLQKAVFPGSGDVKKEFRKVEKVKSHLKSHDLWGRKTEILPEVDLMMPELQGKDIDAHFRTIAITQVEPYSKLLCDFISAELPTIPQSWQFVAGWVRYGKDGTVTKVSYPQENIYVFDIEVCVSDGKYPTLAVALSDSAFYLWCSPRLVSGAGSFGTMEYKVDDLIPLETDQGRINKQARLVIGHNIGFDRARVREQYLLERTRTKFLDTMSLHVAVSGITSYQRSFIMSQQAGKEPKKDNVIDRNSVTEWQHVSSKNGLSDVLNLYCNQKLNKEARNVFVEGTMKDIREDFQNLATYCASDCVATYKVLKEVWPMYYERFPHPVTFAGMLEMGSSILPINSNWDRYIQSAETTFNEMETILNHTLTRQANHAVQLDRNSKYSTDPWLWDLDWSKQEIRVKKTIVKKKKSVDPNPFLEEQADIVAYESGEELVEEVDRTKFVALLNSAESLFKRNAFMPGYPQWYRELCSKDGAVYGPEDMSTSLLVVPKILKLTWQGYPLHYLKGFGWGYLVPGRDLEKCKSISEAGEAFPLKMALKMFPPGLVGKECQMSEGDVSSEEYLQSLRAVSEGLIEGEDKKNLWDEYRATHELQPFSPKDFRTVTADKPDFHTGIGPYDVGIPGCWFFRLPHKDSGNRNVGNPLSKDYLSNVSGGLLRSQVSGLAEKLLKINKSVSFWKMYRDRVMSQIVVRVDKKQLPKSVQESQRFSPTETYGAILPMTVVAGTLTRRAVEATWMTASNAYKDRIGSELKSMVQAPPEYHLVGADVDSQELWIASVIGDAAFAAEHGSTAFGWMTLQGKKSEGTDMHSRTAATVAISRDQAKILNYGRIYGAGEEFAKTLLKKFNANLTDEEAREKARKMYASTKGVRALLLNDVGQSLLRAAGMNPNKPVSRAEIRTAKDIVRKRLKDDELDYHFYDILRKKNSELTKRVVWFGGTESHMFNKLEEIVEEQLPKTPVLECAITRALEPGNVGQSFMTSRVNWVVQSSAVDYLHLMLVSMRYLFDAYGIEGRFCISIHDEVRYLVRSEDRYRAALALHVTNLWTRAMFAHKLGMNKLPQSVAFFSNVDIDTVLRKEVNMDCVTPSNPLGLNKGYGIPFGESVDIYETIRKTGGNLKKVETDK